MLIYVLLNIEKKSKHFSVKGVPICTGSRVKGVQQFSYLYQPLL